MLCILYFSEFRIAERRDAVIARRQKLKTVSAARAKKLQDSLAWQNFKRDANEVYISIEYVYTCTQHLQTNLAALHASLLAVCRLVLQ